MTGFSQLCLVVALIWGISFFRLPLFIWTVLVACILFALTKFHWVGLSAWFWWPLFLIVVIPLNIPFIRRQLIMKKIFDWFRSVLPPMSATEKEAIEAGGTGWEKDLFQGKPNWRHLMGMPKSALTDEEQTFLDTQVEIFCDMLNDWQIVHEKSDLPPNAWDFLKKEKFFGMIIPKQYGGLEFSPLAHSAVITKIATRSVSAAVTTMVPNSLGPAELLLHYGTDEQKNYYLPRLAEGKEIPCFALTAPEAGSDAGAIPDEGVVCKGLHEGKEVIGIRLTFDKRYITLAPVATVFGLAFKMVDPDHLLSEKTQLGITLCLIPTNHPGVEIGHRHFPLNLAFMNGPIRGKDVFVPLDWIIGGAKMAGLGWQMLMACLSAGRGISLPALSTASGMLAYRMAGAYSVIRKQFNVAISAFEGVEEALARISAMTYTLESARTFTAGMLCQGIKPSVATAISKYHMTEMARKILNDAMDIHGGRGIMLGPHNYLGRGYQSIPVSITVEGANILTRSLMIFGQGAIRCHPYAQEEMKAAELYQEDKAKALKMFDKYCIKHMGYFASILARSVTFSLTRGHASVVRVNETIRPYVKKLNWLSAALALSTDVALFTLGGELKRKESISARLGDVLSQLYLASAVLKYYDSHEYPTSDLPLVKWSLEYCLYQIQEAFYGLFENFPIPIVGKILKWSVFPYGRAFSLPKDKLGQQCVQTMLSQTKTRQRVTELCYVGKTIDDPTGLIEITFQRLMEIQPSLLKITNAIKAKEINKHVAFEQQIKIAVDKRIVSEYEATKINEFEVFRKKAIAVDEFTPDYDLGSQT